jgi:hypothetical protein
MGFKFAKSQIELEHDGQSYNLSVNTRLAVDLERHIGMHPLTLATKINNAISKQEIPPLGQMAEFFEFMLKRAGCRSVDFDELYGAMYDGTDAVDVGRQIGELLMLFMPQTDEQEAPKPKPKRATKI